MPSIVKGGPKLPSFQKLKKKKRAAPESAETLADAPKSKKPVNSIPGSSQASSDKPKVNKDSKKRAKVFEWKKKMSAEKEERLKKAKSKTTETSTLKPSSAPKPEVGQNWKKLQSTMTHVRKPRSEKDGKLPVASSELDAESKTAQEEENMRQKKQNPAGWNPSNVESTEIVAIDCEMVGVGLEGKQHSLARVVIVNYYGGVLLDRFVAQIEPVEDYRTEISGVRPQDLKNAPSLKKVQQEVFKILKDKIVVGHQLTSDFKALLLDHPQLYVRDTARYRALQKSPGKPHSLRQLAAEVLEMNIQEGEHDPAEDARIAMLLYRFIQKNWEASIKTSVKNPASVNPVTKLIEKANRAAINAQDSVPTKQKGKNDAPPKKSKTLSTHASSMDIDDENNSEDSWASSGESEQSDSDTSDESDSDSESS